jgi:hypothetical protein
MDSPPKEWKYAFIVFGCFIFAVLITNFIQYCFPSTSTAASKNNGNSEDDLAEDSIPGYILKESARYDALSQQDQNVAYSLMHINYALAYANVLRQISSDTDIQSKTGISMPAYIQKLQETQQKILQSLGQQCPNVLPSNAYAIATGWLA